MKRFGQNNAVLIILCLVLVNALALLPLLTTGFISDDIYNSEIRGHMIQRGMTLWGVTVFYAKQWLRNEGRLFPMTFYLYSVFYLLRSVLLYKCFVLGVTLANISVFFVFLRRFTRSERISAFAVLLLPLLFQFRLSWDPLLAFCAEYPLVGLLLCCSFYLFLVNLDQDSDRARITAVTLFLWASLIFEVAYPMCLVFGVLAYLRLRIVKSAVRASWPFFAVTIVLMLSSAVLRAFAVAPSGVYRPNLNPAVVTKAYLTQLFGATPFSYYLVDPHALFSEVASRWPGGLSTVLGLVLLVAAFALHTLRGRLSHGASVHNPPDARGILTIGAMLFALPACLISLSTKYQAQTWGDAYLPVYLAYFGVSVLLAVPLDRLYRTYQRVQTSRPWLRLSAVCVWLLLLGLNFRNNWLAAEASNEAVWNPRVLLEEALDRGLLAGIDPQKALLLVSGTEPWDNPDEYSTKTGLRFYVYSMAENRDWGAILSGSGACGPAVDPNMCKFSADATVYTVQIRHLSGGTGAIILARVRQAYLSNGSIRGILSQEGTAYFRLPPSRQPLAAALSGMDAQDKSGATIFRMNERDLHVIKEGRGWKFVSFRRRGMFDALSLRGEISAEGHESSFLVSKDPSRFELHAAGPEVLHVGYEGGQLGNAAEYPAIDLQSDLSVEVLVNPADSQRPFAEILSDHWADSRGLAIEQLGDDTNHYALVLGSGQGWMKVGDVRLSPGRRHYLALEVKDANARLYLDGRVVGVERLPKPVAASPYPVQVGNWRAGDRSFNGLIEEVLIGKLAKAEEVISADAKRLSAAGEADQSPDHTLLKGNGPLVTYKKLGAQIPPFAILPNTVPLPDDFTVELLLRPAASQTTGATIFSNYSGKQGIRGVTLEQTGQRTNNYALAFGDGKEWMPAGSLFLSPDSLHCLTVTRDKRQIDLYLDGFRVAGQLIPANLLPSESPLTIGNSVSKDRPFNGSIQEVRITRKAAQAQAIADNGARLRRASALPDLPTDPFPVLVSGFYGWEGDWRKGAHSWSQGPGELILTNPAAQSVERGYTFTLNTLSKRQVTIMTPTESKTFALAPGKSVTAGPFSLRLPPGQTSLRFDTDSPAVPAGAGDSRKMTFSITMAVATAK